MEREKAAPAAATRRGEPRPLNYPQTTFYSTIASKPQIL